MRLFDSKLAKKLFQSIMDAADESQWFYESSKTAVNNAQTALRKAIKTNVDDFTAVGEDEASDIAYDIVDEWSYDEDTEAVKSVIMSGIELYNK